MKKLLSGLMLLASMSTFAQTYIELSHCGNSYQEDLFEGVTTNKLVILKHGVFCLSKTNGEMKEQCPVAQQIQLKKSEMDNTIIIDQVKLMKRGDVLDHNGNKFICD